MCGYRIFELKSKELIDVGVLTKIKIASILAKYPPEFVMQNKGRSYPEEVRMVEEYADRNKVLKMIIDHTDPKHNILILVNHLKHVKLLQEWFEQEIKKYKNSLEEKENEDNKETIIDKIINFVKENPIILIIVVVAVILTIVITIKTIKENKKRIKIDLNFK